MENAWAQNKSQIDRFYPDDPQPYEDMRFSVVYPICKAVLKLEFPLGYEVQPRCVYTLADTEKEIELQCEPEKNVFFIENLHQDEITAKIYPEYYFIWDVPD